MYKLGNLTIVLPSYNCDKNCPFCIAKNNKKFKGEKEDFVSLANQLKKLKENGIKFDRIVLSGNGEPSLYSIEELKEYAKIIKENEELFDTLRVHTSGNIFWEKEKFELFNNLVSNVEFDVLRLVVNASKDMRFLGYNRDYTQSELFKRAKKIKIDIGLTKNLESEGFSELIEELIDNNNNIGIIRFKNLMSGENEQSKQATWVRENQMTKKEFMCFANNLLEHCKSTTINNLKTKNGTKIIIENSGNYLKDIVYSNGELRDYSEKKLDIIEMKNMAMKVDNTKELIYDEER